MKYKVCDGISMATQVEYIVKRYSLANPDIYDIAHAWREKERERESLHGQLSIRHGLAFTSRANRLMV